MNSRSVRSLLSVGLALWVCAPLAAQRGGGHAGSAPSSHAGFAPAAHGGFASQASHGGAAPGVRYGAPGAFATNPAGVRGLSNSQGSLFLPPGITSTRPIFYSNGIRRDGNAAGRGGRNTAGYGGVGYGGLGYGYPGYLDFGYGDEDAFDPLDPNNATNTYSGNSAQDAFVNAPPEAPRAAEINANGDAGYYGQPGPEPSEASQPPVPYAPQQESARYATRPQRAPAAPLREEDAVTIVFKDGRPSEQIHNYALTRTSLYVTTDRVRTIPIDDIDMAATEKANQKAGVDFQLPTK